MPASLWEVKALLCSEPVLLAPRLYKPFKLYMDASHIGAGAVLVQADKQGINNNTVYFIDPRGEITLSDPVKPVKPVKMI